MSDFILNAQARSDIGKGASRRLRRNANLIPAVIYGAHKAAVAISLENREMARLLLNDAAFSSILTIHLDGKKEDVLIKDMQRHPAKGSVLHVDFIRVVANQKLTTLVPVTLLNEENCVGIKRDGGEIFRLAPELEVSCLPKDLPDAIEVDVTNMEVGQIIHLEDIKAPKGVEFPALAHGNNIAVVSVNASRVSTEEDDDDSTEEEETTTEE